jgi:hypothetical protein
LRNGLETTANGQHEYVVYDNFTIEIWNKDDGADAAPWFRQPSYPDNTPFESKEKAIEWAENMLTEYQAPPVVEETVLETVDEAEVTDTNI